MERENSELPVTAQAKLLSLNRTGIYYKPAPVSPGEIAVKRRIDEIYTQHPYYGSRRITAQLRREGIPVNRKRVQRYMREMAIAGICPGINLSKRNTQHRIYPYLLRNVTCTNANHIWGIDITYIRLKRGWMYLVAVIDWFSRYVVSWELDQTLEMPFVLTAVKRALDQAKPVIWNSDQGSHFTSPQYIELLKAADVRISMDGKGRAADNIITERFWRALKYEEVYLKVYESPKDARRNIARYIEYYNSERPHQSLGYRTPAEVYYSQHFAEDTGETGEKVVEMAYKMGTADTACLSAEMVAPKNLAISD